MGNIVTISTDTNTTVYANSSDTKYVIPEGIDIVAAKGFDIDASQDAANRTFQIDGHLGSLGGILIGTNGGFSSSANITIGATGVVDASLYSIWVYANNVNITNNGEIKSAQGIIIDGEHVSIDNAGLIETVGPGVSAQGGHLTFNNTGVIHASTGIFMASDADGSSVTHNSGTIISSQEAYVGFAGHDKFYNSGIVEGHVRMNDGNGLYDGQGGVVHGLITGDGGHDILKGGAHVDHLSGGTEHDVLLGRGGADVFIFSSTFDADTIQDFHSNDVIDLSAMKGFDSFADLKGHMHESGNDAILNFGHGDILTLNNVDFHDLSKADFLF